MPIPTTFSPVLNHDFTLNPIKVTKGYTCTNVTTQNTASGHNLIEGYYSGVPTPVGSSKAANDPTNSVDGTYKHIIWNSIDHMYYRNGNNPFTTFEHYNPRFTFKNLSLTASILSIPYFEYGEKIKPGTVEISNSTYSIELVDDGNGNLYDATLESNLTYLPRINTVAYWGFNNEFRKFNHGFGTIKDGRLKFQSGTFNPDSYDSRVKNVKYVRGVTISGNDCGIAAEFTSSYNEPQYILTQDHKDFNFDSLDEFTISCWINVPTINDGIEYNILTKKAVEFENKYISSKNIISSSYTNSEVDVYPFDLTITNNTIKFRRSDGIRTIQLTRTLSSGWKHVSVTRYNDGSEYKLRMVVNGSSVTQQTDSTVNPINKKCVMIGSHNQIDVTQFTGVIDEIRILNTAIKDGGSLDTTFYQNLATPAYAFNTSVVGNVFYRRGNIVVSPLNDTYKNALNGSFEVKYKGVHTIYEFEALCRIKKGSFNLTRNPTALKSPKSDLLLDDFTGSLQPYATTVGLYNDKGQLMAVAKLGQALQMREDVDINLAIKWDI